MTFTPRVVVSASDALGEEPDRPGSSVDRARVEAAVRELLIAEAARRLELPAENFRTENGVVISTDGQRFGYGDLVEGSG